MNDRSHGHSGPGHSHDHGLKTEKRSHHSHSHSNAPTWLLALGLVFNLSIFLAGWYAWQKSESVGILADSLHDSLHCIIYAVAIWGNVGYNQRRQAHAKIGIGITMIATALFIGTFGMTKVFQPNETISTYMIVIASFNLASELLVGGLMLKMKYKGVQVRKIYLIRAILLDITVDILGSSGVLLAGILVLTIQYYRADAFAAIAIAVVALIFGILSILDAKEELKEDDHAREELNPSEHDTHHNQHAPHIT